MNKTPVFLAFDLSTVIPADDPKKNLFDFYLLDQNGKDLLYRRRQKLTKLPELLIKNLPYRPEIVVWDNPDLLPFHPLELRQRYSAILPVKSADLNTVQSCFFYINMFFNLDRTMPMKIFTQDERATFLRHEASGLIRLYEIAQMLR